MGRTHELRIQSQGSSVLPAVGGSALILIVVASLVLLLHPSAARDLSHLYASLRATGQIAAWGDSALRASMAAACASATIYVLVGFGRGVQSAPFLWLSPVLLGFGMAVMMRMRVAPVLPMAEPVYYVASALVLLGGGALLQRRGWAGAVSGSLLMLIPLGTLIAGYAHKAGGASLVLTQLTAGAALHAFVLLVMSVGLAFIAVTTRDEAVSELSRTGGRRRYGRHAEGEELEAALERARISEIRVQAAEERVSVAQQQLRMQAEELESALSIQDEIKKLAPRRLGVRLLLTGFALIALFGAFMAAFFGLWRPLQLKAAQAQALATHLEQERTTLTQGFETERSALLQDLTQARVAVTEAKTNIEKLQGEMAALAATQAALAPTEPVVEPPVVEPVVATPVAQPTPRAKAARTQAKSRAKKKPQASRAARGSTAVRAPSSVRAPSRGEERASEMNDDPIAGLDL